MAKLSKIKTSTESLTQNRRMEDSLNNDSLSLAEEKVLHKELEKLKALGYVQ